MTRKHAHTPGFTTVELLVTLIVATLFLGAGYLLYQTLLLRSAEAQWQQKASSLAYGYVKQYAAETETPCVASTPAAPVIPNGTLPGDPSVSVAISCPKGTSSNISRTTVTITYGTPEQEVVHARDSH